MIFSKTESMAFDIAYDVCTPLGYEVYDVMYVKEGPYWFLRIFINSENGVNLDDCETVSRQISDILDEKDFIENNYFLEVSSPGVERVLRQEEHYSSAVGECVHIKLFKPEDGVREIEGELTAFEDGIVTVNCDGRDFNINKKNIAKANVVFAF